MFWMTLVSFRRNGRKYSLSIISLALAVTVSCLGLSGLELLQRSTTDPLTFLAGGQIMLIDERTNLQPAGVRLYADPLEVKPFPLAVATEILQDIPNNDQTIETLVAPFMRYGEAEASAYYIAARNRLPSSLASLEMLEGKGLSPSQMETLMIIPGGEYVSATRMYIVGWYRMETDSIYGLTIPRAVNIDEMYDWDLATAVEHTYTVSGIYDQLSALYPIFWTNLELLQSQIGGPELVSWVGVPCARDQIANVKAQLETAIAAHNLPLRALSIYDLGEMLIGDFEKFEKMADYYTPVMLFVAVQIVLVNAVAIVLTRRKELALLRTIGFSLAQIQLMFVLECFFTAVSGALLGTGIAAMVAFGLSQSFLINYMPLAVTLLTTTAVSGIAILIIGRGSLSQPLRNPAG